MKRFLFISIVGLLLIFSFVSTAFATGNPVGGCPDAFELHMVMPHEEHGHRHVGTETDLNGDGWICAKVVDVNDNNHVHIDNNVPLP
jgi:hypothetical protein